MARNENMETVRAATRLAHVAALTVLVIQSLGCVQLYPANVGSVGVDYWFTDLRGDLIVNNSAQPDPTIDLGGTLGIEEEETFNIRASVPVGNVTIEGSFFDTEFSGSRTIGRTFEFDGEEFFIGTNVRSDLELLFTGVRAKFGMIELGPVVVGGVAGINYFDFEARLRTQPLEGKETLNAPFPVLGAVATLHQPLTDHLTLFADAEISGFYVPEISDLEILFFDIPVRAGLQFGHGRLGAGYRTMELEWDDSNDPLTWEILMGGPFVFLEFVY